MNEQKKSNIRQELEAIVGEEFVLDDMVSRMIFSRAVSPLEFKRFQKGDHSKLPAFIVQPISASEISAILILANYRQLSIVPFGGGSGIAEGTSLTGSIVVDLKRFNEIEIDPINMTTAAGAGVNGKHLEEFLNDQGYTCGHFPQSLNSATVGGYVATAAVGTFSGRYGKIEDIVIGLEAVLANGEILKVRPIPRRSTGMHLEALFIGSEGTLGIITKAILKIYQIPEKRTWQVYTFSNTPGSLEALRRLIQNGIEPALVRLYDESEAAARLHKFGLSVGCALLILSFEGSNDFVDWQMKATSELLTAQGGKAQDVLIALDWYRHRFDTSKMLQTNQLVNGVSDAIEVAASWSNIEAVWSAMRIALSPLAHTIHCHFSHIYHNECSVYVIFYAESALGTAQAGMELYESCLKAALEACLFAGGSISHHHGVGRTKSRWMRGEHGQAGLNTILAVKNALDPNHILNPGSLGVGQ